MVRVEHEHDFHLNDSNETHLVRNENHSQTVFSQADCIWISLVLDDDDCTYSTNHTHIYNKSGVLLNGYSSVTPKSLHRKHIVHNIASKKVLQKLSSHSSIHYGPEKFLADASSYPISCKPHTPITIICIKYVSKKEVWFIFLRTIFKVVDAHSPHTYISHIV